jgi:defect in organelle trafficking protein DotC
MLKFKKHYKLTLALVCMLFTAVAANASVESTPITLETAKNIGLAKEYKEAEEDSSKLNMRIDAMKEAALSYGAQSGAIYRNWEIAKIINKQETILDTVFNFSRLMIPTHYGALIEPPIVSENENSFLLGERGMSASMTSKTYSIGENVKIVTTPKNWRRYLLDHIDLTAAEKPDIILRPRDKSERKTWKKYVKIGWDNGVDQANDVFSENLALLLADYKGMIRYRKLLAQKMISEPFAVKENRGITGNANELRIDDKAIIITSIPALNKSSDAWEPTER